MQDTNAPISRRRALAIGGSIAGGLALAATAPHGVASSVLAAPAQQNSKEDFSKALIKQMENVLQTDGTQSNGVLMFELDRKDLKDYTLGSAAVPPAVPYKPAWQNNGQFYFQKLSPTSSHPGGSNGVAMLNGDFGGLLPQEIDPFIDQLIAHGITFQALHQHFYDIHPQQLYYIHFRAIGDPIALAKGVIAAVKVTGTPLPQFTSGTPTTPLPVSKLVSILGGSAQVGEDGVVTVSVPRLDQVFLSGIPIKPDLNIATPIAFEPLDSSGKTVAAAPDFGMVASEVEKVIRVMRSQHWVIGCLYNQETDEFPQLYFSHQLKVGDPLALAYEIRLGLDQMNTPRP